MVPGQVTQTTIHQVTGVGVGLLGLPPSAAPLQDEFSAVSMRDFQVPDRPLLPVEDDPSQGSPIRVAKWFF